MPQRAMVSSRSAAGSSIWEPCNPERCLGSGGMFPVVSRLAPGLSMMAAWPWRGYRGCTPEGLCITLHGQPSFVTLSLTFTLRLARRDRNTPQPQSVTFASVTKTRRRTANNAG